VYQDQSYPVVLLDNFLKDKVGRSLSSYYELLAQWAGWLVENEIAHVVVVGSTGQRGSGEIGVLQALGRALPTKTVEVIPLRDMPNTQARKFLRLKLDRLAQVKQAMNSKTMPVNVDENDLNEIITYLGGRASDLEAISHKLGDGKTVRNALDEMIHKAMLEIHKHGMNGAGWTSAQLWYILRQFSNNDGKGKGGSASKGFESSLSFEQIRFSPLFSGNESPILDMERAELLALVYKNGRPVSIRLNKPLYITAVEKMFQDEQFTSSNDVIMYKAMYVAEEAKLKSYEEEYALLANSAGKLAQARRGVDSAIQGRLSYLTNQMADSQKKITEWMDKLSKAKSRL
jgi:hypothetical protein